MKLNEITKKQFVNALKNPSKERRRIVADAVREILYPMGYKVKSTRVTKSGELNFIIPGIIEKHTYEKVKSALEKNLPKDAAIMNSWYLGNDYQTPLGYLSVFIEPNMSQFR